MSHEPAAPVREPARDLVGKPIAGKYLIRGILGEGGMGTVFEAEQTTIGRLVALKVLHPSRARKRDAVRRFYREARAAAAIGHPNICEVYDLGSLDDGSPFLVMEKLEGETLAERIAVEGGLPFEHVIEFLVQILSALAAAHAKRIVHRDVKPENVFLTRRLGSPPLIKLLDFGVSKMMGPVGGHQDELNLTRTGMVMGTPYYMSPEQARGDRDLDTRVDLYACGVILYEALTGRRPFVAANYNALLVQILSTTPRPARDLRPAMPAGFDAVIEKAMERDRDRRYQSAGELKRDLQSLGDRHGSPLRGQGLDGLRAARAPAKWPVSSAIASAPPGHDPIAFGEGSPPVIPPVPSSIDIPVIFAGDTPASGEHAAVDPMAHPSPTAPKLLAPLDDEDPTEVQMSSPFGDDASDADVNAAEENRQPMTLGRNDIAETTRAPVPPLPRPPRKS